MKVEDEREQTRLAEQALMAFAQAQNEVESLLVYRDFHDVLLSEAAQEYVRKWVLALRVSGDARRADQFQQTFKVLRERLQSSAFMAMVKTTLAKENL